MQRSEKKTFYVAIAGNIGVGKTTFTRYLCDHFGWYPFFENFGENPYLEAFYEDMPRWAFQSQVFFLKERLKDLDEMRELKVPCVQDRSIYEDAEIFARNLYERQLMTRTDYLVYHDLYERIGAFLRPPDLLIYLRATTWTLISRIRKRGREFEQDIDKEYLMQLNSLYERWVHAFAKEHKVLVVDTDGKDMYKNVAWMDGILSEAEQVFEESLKRKV